MYIRFSKGGLSVFEGITEEAAVTTTTNYFDAKNRNF